MRRPRNAGRTALALATSAGLLAVLAAGVSAGWRDAWLPYAYEGSITVTSTYTHHDASAGGHVVRATETAIVRVFGGQAVLSEALQWTEQYGPEPMNDCMVQSRTEAGGTGSSAAGGGWSLSSALPFLGGQLDIEGLFRQAAFGGSYEHTFTAAGMAEATFIALDGTCQAMVAPVRYQMPLGSYAISDGLMGDRLAYGWRASTGSRSVSQGSGDEVRTSNWQWSFWLDKFGLPPNPPPLPPDVFGY